MRGSVQKRGDAWRVVVEAGRTADGKRRRVTATVHGSKADADRKLRAMLREHDAGLIQSADLTVRDLADDWLEARKTAPIEPETWVSNEQHLRLHIVPQLGDIPVAKLTRRHVEVALGRVLNEEPDKDKKGQERHRGHTTVRRVHSTLRRMLNDAVRWEIVPHNVATNIELPKPTDRHDTITILDETEVKHLLTQTREDRWWPLWVVYATTGMRRSEALGLKWSDLDLKKGTIRIERQRQAKAGLKRLKTKRSRRTIRISKQTVRALKAWRRRTTSERLMLGDAYRNADDLVFVWENGRAPYPNYPGDRFIDLVEELGLPDDATLHDLRHSHAAHLLKRGVDLKTVSERLGHASIVITADTYLPFVPELDQKAADISGDVVPDDMVPDGAETPHDPPQDAASSGG